MTQNTASIDDPTYIEGRRDGATAERARIVAILRDPSDELRFRMCCGESHCHAADRCLDHDISPDGYAERYGCESLAFRDETLCHLITTAEHLTKETGR